MRLRELLTRAGGADKRFVYYLEAQGVIQPARLPKSRIDRREYSEEDVSRIRRIWRYYQQGYALNTARDLAEREVGTEAFVLLGSHARRRDEALEALKTSDRVVEVAAVYGERVDLVVRLEAAREAEVFEALHPAFDRGLLSGHSEILKTRKAPGPMSSTAAKTSSNADGMRAFVLLRVPAKEIDRTLERLQRLDGVVEASVVYGETDIIAKLEVPNQPVLDELVIRQIQGLPEVEATRTFIVVGGLHWSRV